MHRNTAVNLIAFIEAVLNRGQMKPTEMAPIGIARDELIQYIQIWDAQNAQPVEKEIPQKEILDNVDMAPSVERSEPELLVEDNG